MTYPTRLFNYDSLTHLYSLSFNTVIIMMMATPGDAESDVMNLVKNNPYRFKPDYIETLEHIKHTALTEDENMGNKNENDDCPTCPICLYPIEKVVKTLCKHNFHIKCICNLIDYQWLEGPSLDQLQLTCPVCRQDLYILTDDEQNKRRNQCDYLVVMAFKSLLRVLMEESYRRALNQNVLFLQPTLKCLENKIQDVDVFQGLPPEPPKQEYKTLQDISQKLCSFSSESLLGYAIDCVSYVSRYSEIDGEEEEEEEESDEEEEADEEEEEEENNEENQFEENQFSLDNKEDEEEEQEDDNTYTYRYTTYTYSTITVHIFP